MTLDPIAAAAAACALLLLVVYLVAGIELRKREFVDRLREVTTATATQEVPRYRARNILLVILRYIGEALRNRAILSEKDLADLERTVAAGGFNPRRAVSTFIGIKVSLFLLLPAMGYGVSTLRQDGNELLFAALGAVTGLMGPNWVLGYMHRRHVAEMNRGLPDALDLLVVCAEAGLGLEAAVERVAREMGASNSAVAREFSLLAHELRVLPDRRMALTRMAARTSIPSLQQLAGTLAQTMRFGTPLAQALRVLSSDSRQERMLRLETKAARLPALMVLPLILFIMPCLFIVLLGPSIMSLMGSFGK